MKSKTNLSEIIEENNHYYIEIKKYNKNISKKDSVEYKKMKQILEIKRFYQIFKIII